MPWGVDKAHLVGESQGGQIGVFTAYNYPKRVDKLALIVGGIPSNEHGYSAGITRLHDLAKEATERPSMETVRKRMEWLFHDPSMLPDELVAVRLKIYEQAEFYHVSLGGSKKKLRFDREDSQD
jgi:2-hydroxy-6-oxonona-2,4-dienedioate hydrolase